MAAMRRASVRGTEREDDRDKHPGGYSTVLDEGHDDDGGGGADDGAEGGVKRLLYPDCEDATVLLPEHTQWMAMEPYGFEAAIDDELGYIYFLDHLRQVTHVQLSSRHSRPSWRLHRSSNRSQGAEPQKSVRRSSLIGTQQVFEVDLTVEPGASLPEKFGFDTTGDKQCFVSNILADSPLARAKVPLGSELVQINNTDVSHFSGVAVRSMLMQCEGHTSLSLQCDSRTRRRTFDKSSSLRIFLADGRYKTLSFWPNTTVRDTIEELCEKLDIACRCCFELLLETSRGGRDSVVLPRCFSVQHVAKMLAVNGNLKCCFRFQYIPRTPDRLLRHDTKAFELLYEQSCRDLVAGAFPTMSKETVLTLGAINIYLWSILQGKQKIDLQAIGKSVGFDQLMPSAVVDSFKPRELRRILRTNLKNLEAMLQSTDMQAERLPNTLRLFFLKLVCNQPVVVTHAHDAFVRGISGKVMTNMDGEILFKASDADVTVRLCEASDARRLHLSRTSANPLYEGGDGSHDDVFYRDVTSPPVMLAEMYRFRCKHTGLRSSSSSSSNRLSSVASAEYMLTISCRGKAREEYAVHVISTMPAICGIVQSIVGFHNAHYPASMTQLLKDEAFAYGLRGYFATHAVFTLPWNYGVDFRARVEGNERFKVQFNPLWFGIVPGPEDGEERGDRSHFHSAARRVFRGNSSASSVNSYTTATTATTSTTGHSAVSGARARPATQQVMPTGRAQSTASPDTGREHRMRIQPRVVRVQSQPTGRGRLLTEGAGADGGGGDGSARRGGKGGSRSISHVPSTVGTVAAGPVPGDGAQNAQDGKNRPHGPAEGGAEPDQMHHLLMAVKEAERASVRLENALNPAGPESSLISAKSYAETKRDLWLGLQALSAAVLAYVVQIKKGEWIPLESVARVSRALQEFVACAESFIDVAPDTIMMDEHPLGDLCVGVSHSVYALLQANVDIKSEAPSCAPMLLAFLSAGLQHMETLHELATQLQVSSRASEA